MSTFLKFVFIITLIVVSTFVFFKLSTNRPAVVFIEPDIIDQVDYQPPQDKLDTRAQTLDEFFAKRKMPLAGKGGLFVEAADRFGNDWRLLPAISVRESSGGKEACGFNAFGWGSCRGMEFSSTEEAIVYISDRLANSPLYIGKTDYQKLRVYNPPEIVATYADEVIAIMQSIQRD